MSHGARARFLNADFQYLTFDQAAAVRGPLTSGVKGVVQSLSDNGSRLDARLVDGTLNITVRMEGPWYDSLLFSLAENNILHVVGGIVADGIVTVSFNEDAQILLELRRSQKIRYNLFTVSGGNCHEESWQVSAPEFNTVKPHAHPSTVKTNSVSESRTTGIHNPTTSTVAGSSSNPDSAVVTPSRAFQLERDYVPLGSVAASSQKLRPVFGVVIDYVGARQSRGGDFSIMMEIVDPTLERGASLQLHVFFADERQKHRYLPPFAGCLVLIRRVFFQSTAPLRGQVTEKFPFTLEFVDMRSPSLAATVSFGGEDIAPRMWNHSLSLFASVALACELYPQSEQLHRACERGEARGIDVLAFVSDAGTLQSTFNVGGSSSTWTPSNGYVYVQDDSMQAAVKLWVFAASHIQLLLAACSRGQYVRLRNIAVRTAVDCSKAELKLNENAAVVLLPLLPEFTPKYCTTRRDISNNSTRVELLGAEPIHATNAPQHHNAGSALPHSVTASASPCPQPPSSKADFCDSPPPAKRSRIDPAPSPPTLVVPAIRSPACREKFERRHFSPVQDHLQGSVENHASVAAVGPPKMDQVLRVIAPDSRHRISSLDQILASDDCDGGVCAVSILHTSPANHINRACVYQEKFRRWCICIAVRLVDSSNFVADVVWSDVAFIRSFEHLLAQHVTVDRQQLTQQVLREWFADPRCNPLDRLCFPSLELVAAAADCGVTIKTGRRQSLAEVFDALLMTLARGSARQPIPLPLVIYQSAAGLRRLAIDEIKMCLTTK
jgi:hypothetical protein